MTIILLLIAHFLADFTFQSSKMAEQKKVQLKSLAAHTAMYGVCMAAALALSADIRYIWWPLLTLTAAHFAVDFVRIRLEKKADKWVGLLLFFCDQTVHIACLFLVCYGFSLPGSPGLLDTLGVRMYGSIFGDVLLYVIVLWPTAVMIKKVLCYFSEGEIALPRAGYLIGMLERCIVVTLILLGQYGAIGFVVAAKSLARFEQFKQPDFAEKYLIGTLLSTGVALMGGLVIPQFASFVI